jgi:hypothetical protein
MTLTKNLINEFARRIALNSLPGEDSHIGDDRPIGKGAAQFGEGAGDVAGPQRLVDRRHKIALNRTVFGLGHGFLADLTVDVFAGGFGFGQLEEGGEGQRFGEGLNHSG